jgi:hypothetical protein
MDTTIAVVFVVVLVLGVGATFLTIAFSSRKFSGEDQEKNRSDSGDDDDAASSQP